MCWNDLKVWRNRCNTLVLMLIFFVEPVLFQDWKRIDEEEQRRGKLSNKPREKLISVDEILNFITL